MVSAQHFLIIRIVSKYLQYTVGGVSCSFLNILSNTAEMHLKLTILKWDNYYDYCYSVFLKSSFDDERVRTVEARDCLHTNELLKAALKPALRHRLSSLKRGTRILQKQKMHQARDTNVLCPRKGNWINKDLKVSTYDLGTDLAELRCCGKYREYSHVCIFYVIYMRIGSICPH